MEYITKAILASCNGISNNLITCKNEIGSELISQGNIDMEAAVKQSVAMSIARKLLEKTTITKKNNPDNFSTVFEAAVWSFSDRELDRIIGHAYQLGLDGRQL